MLFRPIANSTKDHSGKHCCAHHGHCPQQTQIVIGKRIEDDPCKVIPIEKQHESCDVMLVETGGTTSPQIQEVEGITGREGLKQKTERKECNIVVIEKYLRGERVDRWVGARYDPRKEFEEYVRRAGLHTGQLLAEKVVFIADGLRSNWEIQKTNFPGAVTILDFYHASEHLAKFCNLFQDEKKRQRKHKDWYIMFLEEENLSSSRPQMKLNI